MLSQKVRARKANVKSSTLLKMNTKRKRKMKKKKTEHFRQNEAHSRGGKDGAWIRRNE